MRCIDCSHFYVDDWGSYICDIDNHAAEINKSCIIKEEKKNDV